MQDIPVDNRQYIELTLFPERHIENFLSVVSVHSHWTNKTFVPLDSGQTSRRISDTIVLGTEVDHSKSSVKLFLRQTFGEPRYEGCARAKVFC